jgi:hypothetical protein
MAKPSRRPRSQLESVFAAGFKGFFDRIGSVLRCGFAAEMEAWLAHHPQIRIVSRDRGGGYGEAVSKALPNETIVHTQVDGA